MAGQKEDWERGARPGGNPASSSSPDTSRREDPPPQDALDAGLRLLSARARSVRELEDRLRARGFPEQDVDACLQWFRERELLDDHAFAAAFVRDRIRLSPRSLFLLKRELQERGIAPELAEAVSRQVLEEEGWTENELAERVARSWIRKQAPGLRQDLVSDGFSDERERARRRLMGFLHRRGFRSDAALRGLEAAERSVRDLKDRGR